MLKGERRNSKGMTMSLTRAGLEARHGVDLVHYGIMAVAVQIQLSRAYVRHLGILSMAGDEAPEAAGRRLPRVR